MMAENGVVPAPKRSFPLVSTKKKVDASSNSAITAAPATETETATKTTTATTTTNPDDTREPTAAAAAAAAAPDELGPDGQISVAPKPASINGEHAPVPEVNEIDAPVEAVTEEANHILATPAGEPNVDTNGMTSPGDGTTTQTLAVDPGISLDETSGEPADPSTLYPPATPRQNVPCIRLVSAEAEEESKKVRSLYESTETIHWEDGISRPSICRRPSSARGPAEGEPTVHFAVSAPTGTTEEFRSAADNTSLARNHALAGGMEDWEGVDGYDVDRYGFIIAPRPKSRPGTASDAKSLPSSLHKNRTQLKKKDSNGRSLRVRRGPSRKMSEGSLNSQGSDVSAVSRVSTRSGFRHAMNRLPHNRERRIIDEAGDMLSVQPGLTNITEDEAAERLAEELKHKEVTRTEKWRKMAHVVRSGPEGQGMSFEFDTKNPKLIDRTWKGIPDCWRAAAWYSFLLSSAKASKKPFRSDEDIIADFYELIDQPSPDDGQIDMDVPRTINQHIMFRRRYTGGQRLLFRVLHSLSLYFPDTGYGQGMATLAATLLSYYDEERCFVMLVRLWEYRGLSHLYDPQFLGLLGALKDFQTQWLSTKDVAAKLADLDIDPTAYATRWYLTLFNLSVPFSAQLRVLDVFMLLGSTPEKSASEVPEGQTSSRGLEVLHATSLAIVDAHRDYLIDSDFENGMKTLTSRANIKDVEYFMRVTRVEYKHHMSRAKLA